MNKIKRFLWKMFFKYTKQTIKCTDGNIERIVKEQIELLGFKADLNHLDVSNVTDMECMFKDSPFNGDISKWDVSKVNSMRYMFSRSQFNEDISKWLCTINLKKVDSVV